VTGTQPAEPATECYETATFNDTTCSWDVTDNGTQMTYYADTDNDGFGDPDNTVVDCTLPAGYSTNNSDCDDTDNTIYPGAPEVTNDGIDQDCDGFDQTTLDRDRLEFKNISVTPNPFGKAINITLPLSYQNIDFSVQIFDMNGRLVINRQYSIIDNKINVRGLDKLDQAPYIIKIINRDTGFSMMKQLVKF
jgi:hypothetical protein